MVKSLTHHENSGVDIGAYPNAANIREWMRQYFGCTGINTDIRFTYWHACAELPDINSAEAALRFGITRGFTLTDAGRAMAYESGILSANSPAVPLPQQADTGTIADGGLAGAIGANAWKDIRLVVRADGMTFHGPGGWRALPWDKVGLGEEKAAVQTAFLILLAKAGGCLPHSERAESKPDTGGNRTTWTAKDWEREAERATIRKYSELAADEGAQTKVRANVKRLNKKFMGLFPSIQGRPFENRKGATVTNFKRIEYK